MKKNRKKYNLNELEKQTKRIARQEQESTIGADFYYLPDGTALGQRGSGQQVRVINSLMDFRAYECSEQMLNSRSTLLCYSESGAISNVLQSITGKYVRVSADDPSDRVQAVCDGEGNISINYYGDLYRNGNYWDLYSALHIHEMTHAGQTNTSLSIVEKEKYAYLAQLNDPSFSCCSPEFQEMVRRSASIYL